MLLISKKASYFISLLLFSFAVHASQEHEKNRQKPITEITSPIALIQFEKKASGSMRIYSSKVSPDGRWLAFITNDTTARNGLIKRDLYVASTTNDQIQKVNALWPRAGSVENFEFSLNSQHIIFRGDKDQNYKTLSGLFWVSLEGNTFNTPSLHQTIEDEFYGSSLLTVNRQNSEHVIYSNQRGTFSVSLESKGPPSSTKLLPKGISSLVLGSNNQDIYYSLTNRNDDNIAINTEIYQSNMSTGAPKKLSQHNHNLSKFQLSNDQRFIVYRHYHHESLENHGYQLYAIDLINNEHYELSHTSPHATGSIFDFNITSDSKNVIYYSDANLDNVHEVFRTPLTKPKDQVRLSPTWISSLPKNQGLINTYQADDVTSYSISDDGQYVLMDTSRGIYLSDINGDNLINLFSDPTKVKHYRFVGNYIVIEYQSSELEVFSTTDGQSVHKINGTVNWPSWLQNISISDKEHLFYSAPSVDGNDIFSIKLDSPTSKQIKAKLPNLPTGTHFTLGTTENQLNTIFYYTLVEKKDLLFNKRYQITLWKLVIDNK